MPAALAEVKRRLGDDAVILHTRRVDGRAMLGLGKKTLVEITAASSTSDLPGAPPQVNVPARKRKVAQAQQPAEGAAKPMRAVKEDATLKAVQAMRREIGELKKLVDEVASRPPTGAAEVPAELRETHLSLLGSEVAREIADELTARLQKELSAEERRDPSAVRRRLAEQVANMLPAGGEIELMSGATPKVVALVGPTGVGKTTTVAKLAAQFALRDKKRVALITVDTYRIAAAEQLRTYAEIIGVSLTVVSNPQEMRAAVAEMRDRDVILIDTAGRNPGDTENIAALRAMLRAAGPCERHLVLPANGSRTSLRKAIEGFSGLNIDRVLFSKLDEAVGCGVMLECLQQAKVRMSYVTTGQNVPADIECAVSRRLARAILGERATNEKTGAGRPRG